MGCGTLSHTSCTCAIALSVEFEVSRRSSEHHPPLATVNVVNPWSFVCVSSQRRPQDCNIRLNDLDTNPGLTLPTEETHSEVVIVKRD